MYTSAWKGLPLLPSPLLRTGSYSNQGDPFFIYYIELWIRLFPPLGKISHTLNRLLSMTRSRGRSKSRRKLFSSSTIFNKLGMMQFAGITVSLRKSVILRDYAILFVDCRFYFLIQCQPPQIWFLKVKQFLSYSRLKFSHIMAIWTVPTQGQVGRVGDLTAITKSR